MRKGPREYVDHLQDIIYAAERAGCERGDARGGGVSTGRSTLSTDSLSIRNLSTNRYKPEASTPITGAGVAERTNLLSPMGLKSPYAAGSRPVVPLGTLGFKMVRRESLVMKIPTPAPQDLLERLILQQFACGCDII